jgi:hypothetical protein
MIRTAGSPSDRSRSLATLLNSCLVMGWRVYYRRTRMVLCIAVGYTPLSSIKAWGHHLGRYRGTRRLAQRPGTLAKEFRIIRGVTLDVP